MGQEYHLGWKPADIESAKAWLRRRGGKAVVVEKKEQFEFRFQNTDATTMPDASVALEAGGVYFCDFSGSDRSAALRRGLIDEALLEAGSSDSVVVRSL